jgi:hypothetical protein
MSTPQQHDPRAEPTNGRTTGEAFAQIGEELSLAVRHELDRLREELGTRAAGAAKGTGLLAAAGVTGAVAAGAGTALLLMALRRVLPAWLLATLIGTGAGAASAYLAGRGLKELAVAAPIDTERVKAAAVEAVRTAT